MSSVRASILACRRASILASASSLTSSSSSSEGGSGASSAIAPCSLAAAAPLPFFRAMVQLLARVGCLPVAPVAGALWGGIPADNGESTVRMDISQSARQGRDV
eukprot:scaffold42738_cov65-Phaeocystis_antarctica.AAC.3